MFRFYKQILTGDAADNIMGINGIGPVKADKLLAEAKDENEMYSICLEQYYGNEDRVIENARLLWLRRYENELWQPPSKE